MASKSSKLTKTIMKQQSYCAIIGDINRSHGLEGRGRIQQRFVAAVDSINKEFKVAIASRFLVTLGDEFQGLLFKPEVSYDLMRRFEDLMEPVAFAFGVGIGALSTPLRKDKALGMDGEAFHRARQALGEAKHRKRTVCYSFDSEAEVLVNALITLMDKQWVRLTVRQKRIAQLLKNQRPKDVARRLRISAQAISKTRKSAAMVELEEAAQALRQFLEQLKQP